MLYICNWRVYINLREERKNIFERGLFYEIWGESRYNLRIMEEVCVWYEGKDPPVLFDDLSAPSQLFSSYFPPTS